MEFPDQGLDPSRSWDLSCSCSHAGSLTHSVGLEVETVSQRSQGTADPIASQRRLQYIILLLLPDKSPLYGYTTFFS